MLVVVVEGSDISAVGFLIPVLGITITVTATNHGAYFTSTFSSFGVLECKIFWGIEVCYINFEWAPRHMRTCCHCAFWKCWGATLLDPS